MKRAAKNLTDTLTSPDLRSLLGDAVGLAAVCATVLVVLALPGLT